MNTKNKQDQKKKNRLEQPRKKQGHNNSLLQGRKHHEHEYPEMRMTR
jgi:hypothetical protein